MNELQKKADAYRKAGLNVLPAWKETKRPATSEWRQFQNELYEGAFKTDAICVVCGAISGNLEIIDFDKKAISYNDWLKVVLTESEKQGFGKNLLKKLVCERTQSGGIHVGYRCEVIEPTQKLCAVKIDGKYETTIETRSEGSIALIAPSNGYELINSTWAHTQEIEPAERDILICAARSLTEQEIKPKLRTAPVELRDLHRDSQDEDVAVFLREDDASRKLLLAHGWKCVGDYKEDKELWRRPGKNKGVSATLDKKTGMVFVWSSNAYPLNPNESYTPLQLLAELEYNGDESEAAKSVIKECSEDSEPIYQSPIKIVSKPTVIEDKEEKEDNDLWRYNSIYEIEFPQECLHPGGYLEKVMDYTDSISMRKQRRLAFASAITALSHIMSRRIIYKYSGLTPSMYTIGISPPSSGKSSGRIATQKIFAVDKSGISSSELIESIESVQSLQLAIQQYKKAFLMQDEFGGWLTATMRESSNGNKSRIIDEILKLFSEANNPHYVPRITAGTFKKGENVIPVEYPSFTMYGVSNLLEIQTALNERLLKNGFIARVLFIAGENDSELFLPDYETMKQKKSRDVPEDIVNFFKSLLDFHATDNLNNRIPQLFPVDITKDAYEYIRSYALEREKEYLAINEIDAFDLKVLKGRSFEKVIKYALNFAVSAYGADENRLIIDLPIAKQAVALSAYEHKLYEFLAKTEIAPSEINRQIKMVEKWLRSRENFTKKDFTKRFKDFNSVTRADVLKTLEERGVLESYREKSEGSRKATTVYIINRKAL